VRQARLALPVLARVLDEGEPADRALKRCLRAHKELDNDGRALLSRVVFGVACLRARLDHQLLSAGLPLEHASRAALYLIDEAGADPADAAEALGLDVAAATVLERARADEAVWPKEMDEYIATYRSAPLWLVRRLMEDRGAPDTDLLLAACNRAGPLCVRANLLKNDREQLAAALASEGITSRPLHPSPWALGLEGRPNIRGSDAWRGGRFEVQDAGSQRIALLCDAQPGETWVDWCAGRGGKTLALAAALGGDGRLVALDVDAARLEDMRPRLHRAGARGVEVRATSGACPADLEQVADGVLVDAPCSETGTLRRGPDLRWRLDEVEVAAWPERQLAILQQAARAVRPGGRLVYATCSLLTQENEGVVERFLDDTSGFQLQLSERLAPHSDDTDGFFIARMSRE
jgi:16S rRNA (cytosine967-C5)-methyltransferase